MINLFLKLRTKSSPLLVQVCILFSISATSARAEKLLINGAGSTFAAPLYNKWAADFKQVNSNIEVNYQPIGSGGGVRQFLAGTVDFGATDDAMKDEEVKLAKNGVAHIPTAIGAVVLTYNVPGLSLPENKPLRLTAEVIAEIYLEKITKWDDPKIKMLNPQIKFPSQYIIVTSRSDGSGTTALFTDFLSRYSPDWKSKVGVGKSVKFPVGISAKGNEGVTGLIRQNPGSIGYVELTYAKINKLPLSSIKNQSGEFVYPSLEAIKASTENLKDIPSDLRISILDSKNQKAYPISSLTFLLVPQILIGEKGNALLQFLKWSLFTGQTINQSLHYGDLPEAITKRANVVLQSLKTK